MVELPDVPNLDPDAPLELEPSAAGRAAPGASAAEPGGRRATGEPKRPPPPPADAEPSAPNEPKPEAPPEGSREHTKPRRRSTGPGAEMAAALEAASVDEMLHHSAEQMLRLAQLEETLSGLNQSLSDFQDEMHAGFAEMRAMFDEQQNRESAKEEAKRGKESLTQRLDAVEEHSLSASRQQSRLFTLAVVQVVLLAGVVALVLWARRPAPSTPLPSTPATLNSQPPSANLPEDERVLNHGEQERSSPTRRPSKRGRRRRR